MPITATGEIAFEKAKLSEKDEILDYILDDFVNEEAVGAVALGGKPNEEWRSIFAELVDLCLREPMVSFVARDSSQHNRLVGVRMSTVTTPAEFNDFPNKVAALKVKDPMFRKRLGIMQKFLAEMNLVEEMKTCDKLLEFKLLGVHKDYQKKGVASELSKLSISAGRDCGCDHVVVIGESRKSQRVCEKLDLQLVRSINYADLIGNVPKDGTPTVTAYYHSLL